MFIFSSFFSFEIFHDGNKDESKVRHEMFPAGNLHCLDTVQNCLQSKSDDVKKEVFLIPESRFRIFLYLELMIDMFFSVYVKLDE